MAASALTFLFTDIEGSTRLVTQLGIEQWEEVLRDHARIVGGAIAGAGGETVHTQGDSFFAVFAGADGRGRGGRPGRARTRGSLLAEGRGGSRAHGHPHRGGQAREP